MQLLKLVMRWMLGVGPRVSLEKLFVSGKLCLRKADSARCGGPHGGWKDLCVYQRLRVDLRINVLAPAMKELHGVQGILHP